MVSNQFQPGRRRLWILAAALAISFACGSAPRLKASSLNKVRVVVTDARSGDPIFQAHLTLRFRKHGGMLKHSKIISYSAKTNKKGEYQFDYIPEGTITLMVIAPDHETFGKEITIKEDNQLIEVKLKKPQPVL